MQSTGLAVWLEPGAYSGRTSTCVYACHHSCKTQTALLAHFFLPFLGSGFGGADDFRFAPRAAAGFDDEDTNLFLLRAASALLRAFYAPRNALLAYWLGDDRFLWEDEEEVGNRSASSS